MNLRQRKIKLALPIDLSEGEEDIETLDIGLKIQCKHVADLYPDLGLHFVFMACKDPASVPGDGDIILRREPIDMESFRKRWTFTPITKKIVFKYKEGYHIRCFIYRKNKFTENTRAPFPYTFSDKVDFTMDWTDS